MKLLKAIKITKLDEQDYWAILILDEENMRVKIAVMDRPSTKIPFDYLSEFENELRKI